MLNDGIGKCSNCGLDLIEEEEASHLCQKKETDYRLEGNFLWFFDGFRWFKHSLTPNMKQPFRNPEDETRPNSCKETIVFIEYSN
jgi:hypothetical protein